MSRILFAWELGGGLGHLGPFGPIADRLIARGHEITVAARDVERGHVVFGSRPVKLAQAPLCPRTYDGLADPPLNYAEILMRYGYLDAPVLGGLMRAWRGLLDLADADLLIADHAPTALLAARGRGNAGRGTAGRGTARAVFGNSFSVPPPVSPTPNMRPWVEVPRERLVSSDASVLKVLNDSLSADAPRLTALHEIFEGAARFHIGVPVMDAYAPREAGDYLGLYTAVIGSAPPRWPEGTGPRIFVYLHADYPHIEAALAALAASPGRVLLYLLGATPALTAKYPGPRLTYSTGPVDVGAAVAEADLCVSHGNAATLISALRGGKPMVLLPSQLEQFLLASKVERLGVAKVVHPDAKPPDIAGALAGALADAALARTAREFALRHREPAVDTIADTAAARIEALARGRQ